MVSSELISTYLDLAIGGLPLLCMAEAWLSWQLLYVWNKSSQINGTAVTTIFWETTHFRPRHPDVVASGTQKRRRFLQFTYEVFTKNFSSIPIVSRGVSL